MAELELYQCVKCKRVDDCRRYGKCDRCGSNLIRIFSIEGDFKIN